MDCDFSSGMKKLRAVAALTGAAGWFNTLRESAAMFGNPKHTLPAVVALTAAGFAPNAFAYLDPSTGSMILSAIVGLFATLGLALKTYWYKFKSLFNGGRRNAVPAGAENKKHDEGVDP